MIFPVFRDKVKIFAKIVKILFGI